MAGNNLNLAIVLKLVTDNFNKGATRVKASLLSLQRNFLALATAVGAGTVGITNFISRMVDVAKETSRASIALKNVSGSMAAFADHQRWLLDVSKKYGVEINSLTTSFAKFKSAADVSSMSLDDQRKIFESVARAAVSYGLSAEDQKGIFMALSQMMSKNKVMAEELRLQMAERMPVAIQAMAKAAGVTVGELDNLMKQGKVLSADVLPKFADALNQMIAEPDTDNLNKSLVTLSNTFQELTKNLGIEQMLKSLVDGATKALSTLADNVKGVMTMIQATIAGVLGKGAVSIIRGFSADYDRAMSAAVKSVEKNEAAMRRAKSAADDLEIAKGRVVRAEIAYNRAVDKQNKALEQQKQITTKTSAKKRAQIEERLAIANTRVKEREVQLHKALEGQKTAASKAAAMQQEVAAKATSEQIALAGQASATGWTKAMNRLTYTTGVAWNKIKAIVSANIWAAAIAGLTAIITKLGGIISLSRDAKTAVKEMSEWEATPEMIELDDYRSMLTHKDASVRAGALEKINQILGTQLTLEDDINKAVDDRLKILAAEESLRKKEEALAAARAYKNSIDNDSVTRERIQRDLVEPALKAVADAREYLASVSGKSARLKETDFLIPQSVSPDAEGSSSERYNAVGGGLSIPLPLLPLKDVAQRDMAKQQARDMVESIMREVRNTVDDWKLSDVEILEADKIFNDEKIERIKEIAKETGVYFGDALAEGLAQSKTLDDAIRLMEIKDSLESLQREMSNLRFDAIGEGIGSIDGMVNAFGRLSDAMEGGASEWERIMAVWGVFESVAQGIIFTIESVAKARALAAEIEKVSAAQTLAVNTGVAASAVGRDVAMQSGGWAALVTVPAAIAAILAAFSAIPKFAKGGIVGGGSRHGDKILARLNAGEGVLTAEGIESLHDAANPRNSRTVHVVGRLTGRGRDLQAILDTEAKYQKRIG